MTTGLSGEEHEPLEGGSEVVNTRYLLLDESHHARGMENSDQA